MKQLDKLILRSYIGPFILTFGIACFFLVMQFLWKYVDDLMGKGLDMIVIAKLLGLASVKLVILALPLAILLSSIMVMGGFAENSELVAMKSAGMSLFRILRPLLFFILLVAVGAFYFTNEVWPVANLKFRSLLWDVTKKKPTIQLKENIFYNGLEGYTLRVADKKESGELEDILIYDHSSPDFRGNRKVIRAKEGNMKKTEDERHLILTLRDGIMYQEMDLAERSGSGDGDPHIKTRFERQVLRFDLSGFQFERSDEDLFAQDDQMLDLTQLESTIDSLEGKTLERRNKTIQKTADDLWLLRDSGRTDLERYSENFREDSLSDEDREGVIQLALEKARKNRDHIQVRAKRGKRERKQIRGYQIEWHRKFTLSFACVVLFFIGGPLGAIIRKGGLGAPLVAAVILFLLYHILMKSGEEMAKEGAIAVWWGMWMASILLLPLGVLLTYKAANDAKGAASALIPDLSFLKRAFNKVLPEKSKA